MGFCSSVSFLFSSSSSLFLISIFKIHYCFLTFIPLCLFLTVLFPLHLICNVYKSLSISRFTYQFFLSFPLNIYGNFIFIALFPNWHLALVFFPVCALISFVQVDITSGFLCSPGQHIILYFFFGLFWFCLWVYMYIYIFHHTFYCCYKPLPLSWVFQFWSFIFLSFLFSIILIF